jgi:long-chain acyl-CoA synthetase
MESPLKQTLSELLENSKRLYPDNTALSFVDGTPYNYTQAYDLVKGLSRMLLSRKITRGDRVAILSQNMPHWGIAYFAITSMGAVAVPILTDFSEREISGILHHSESSAIVVSDKMASRLKGICPESIQTVILADDFSLVDRELLHNKGQVAVIDQFSQRKQQNEKMDQGTGTTSEPGEDDLAAILYTSGTTGSPKGVMLTHKNLVSNAINTSHIQKVNSDDRLLSVLPLAHTYECTIGFIIPIMSGASIWYLDKLPTPSVLIPAMQKVQPTMMLTVPLIIEKVYRVQVLPKIMKSPVLRTLFKNPFFQRKIHGMAGKKLYKTFGGHLRFFGIGGAKLAADAEKFLRDAKFPYAIGYGLTETSPLLAGSSPDLTRFRSTGFGLPGQLLKIGDPDPETGEGEILARGPNVTQGYYKDKEQTSKAFTTDGWFRTGDLGVFDKDNYLYIKGRLKNMVVGPSGENIYPEEIESVINKQSMVLESIVYEMRGSLVARIHLNYEELEQYYLELKKSARDMQVQMSDIVNKKLNEIKQRVNSEVNRFSRISKVIAQSEPFEKTPTKKIKRYLYQEVEEEL